MVSKIIKQDGQYTFTIGKCKYKSDDLPSLKEVRTELLRQCRRTKVK